MAIARGCCIASLIARGVISVNTTRCSGLSFELAALLQDLGDVPADRLALAVRVGRQVEAVAPLAALAMASTCFSFFSIRS
jgi:hypothetical protein